jgi:hypothetical protein
VSTNRVISGGLRRRRAHSDLFKADAVGACQQEGVSIAAVALARGVNASLLRLSFFFHDDTFCLPTWQFRLTVPILCSRGQR